MIPFLGAHYRGCLEVGWRGGNSREKVLSKKGESGRDGTFPNVFATTGENTAHNAAVTVNKGGDKD